MGHTSPIRLFAIAVLLGLVVVSATSAASELLPNPDLEAGDTSPDGWILASAGSSSAMWRCKPLEAHNGNCAIHLTGATKHYAAFYTDVLTGGGGAGESFALSSYVHAEAFTSGIAVLGVRVFHTDGSKQQYFISFPKSGNFDWQQFSLQFTTQAAYSKIRVGVLARPNGASFWADDISLTASTGAIYYVDTAGSDTLNDGSSGAPWETIQHAVDNVGPGDTIYVRTGTYLGARIEASGTPADWITLKAAPGADVLLNAPGPDNKRDSILEIETWEGDGTVAYWIIEGLEVAGADDWGIDVRGTALNHSHHFIIRGNDVHHNGIPTTSTGIFTAFVDDVTVENNESYNNGEHGIYLSNSGDRFTVRGNELHHNLNCGIHMNGDLSQGGDGTISDGLIEDNVIYENGTGGCSGINGDGITDTLIRNNLLYENHAGGVSLYQTDGAVCSQDNQVLNNTIVQASDGRWAVNIAGTGCVNNKVFNNILLTYHSWRGSIVVAGPSISGFESDYNIVMDRFSTDNGSTRITLAAWQALGYDTNSIISTPATEFVGGTDFHLLSTANARDNGNTLANVLDDLDGILRPVGSGYDIGAYEYVP